MRFKYPVVSRPPLDFLWFLQNHQNWAEWQHPIQNIYVPISLAIANAKGMGMGRVRRKGANSMKA